MKKTALFLAVMLLLSMVVFASCKPSTPSEDPACQHVDRNADLVCDLCQAAVDAFPQPEVPDIGDPDWNNGSGSVEHVHNFVDYVCSCGATSCTHADENNDHICDTCKKVLSQCADEDQNHLCDVCNQKSSDCEDSDGDYACDYCGGECLPANLERVNYYLNISTLETGTLAADSINGKFTIVSGSEIRNRTKTYEGVEYQKSVKIGDSATKIKVDVPGTGKLAFIVQNGSSSADMQFITVTAPDGTVYDIEFVGNVSGSPLVKIELDVTEGEWVISRGKNGGTQDIFELSLSCIVEKADENGFELVAPGKVDYLVSDELDFSGLRLNATFANGKTEPLAVDSVTIDSSAVNTAVSGTYPVVISYKEYAPITINVNYYAPESIELGFDAVEKLPQNTAAGNGVYYNHSWKEVYLVGDELKTDGLSVYVAATCGEKTLKFRVANYDITGFDSSLENIYTLTISAYGVETNVDIHITAATPTPNEDGVYQLLVDPNYLAIAGTLSGPYHVFSTIQGALDFAAKINKAAFKELSILPGLYKEKLEIEIPNLHIIGLGENPDQVVIEWDSLYGLVDAGGFTHTTDSTQTVAIRESATNVTIENITISNYWNTQDRMDAAGLAIERGLALLVQADRFVMKNSKLLGIQDTLELFTGRQYFENVFISGYTDFIFGTNNTTYFKNCTIHVIDTEKDDKGTAGYLTAFKGSNKGANDAIVYGAIFDQCKFTADEGVTAGCTAIGRTWGAYAAVAVINSELGGHISVKGYDSSNNKNTRYISMNGIHPTDSTVQFVEYNNTGAGAITEAVAGMRFLTAEEAAAYANFAVIFGTTNGKVTYLDPWNPASTEIVVDDRTYYYFNGTEGSSGTSYTYADNIQGSVVEWNGLTIDATKGKLTARDSDSQFNQGAKIIFNVEAGTLVTVISYPGYGYYTINGIAHNANDTFSVYFATASEVVIESTATSYIYQIIINPNEEAPAAPTLNEIKVEGLNKNYKVGEELNLADAVVKAYYSDYSVVTVEATVDATAVNNAAAGEYDVVFTYGGKTVTVKVTFEGENADPRKDVNITFGSNGNYKDGDPAVDLSGVTIGDNGGNNSQVKEGSIVITLYAGATLTIKGYNGYTDYTLSDGTTSYVINKDSADHTAHVYTAAADVTVTITITSGSNYFYGIEIKYPVVYDEDTVISLSGTEGILIQGTTGTFEGLNVDATNGKFASNGDWMQVNQGTIVSFNVANGAIVSVTSYQGAENYSIAIADGVCTITCTANGYWGAIEIKYPVVYDEDTVISLSGTEGILIQGATGTFEGLNVDATNGKFASNGDWMQVNTGTIISFNVAEGATVSVTAYTSADNFTVAIADGVCTITCVGNDYLKAITIAFGAEEPGGEAGGETKEEVIYVLDATKHLEAMAQGAKSDGEIEKVGTDSFFTIHYSAKTKIDSSGKKFDDGYEASQRISWGGKTSVKDGKNYIEFTVTDAATVTVWWVSGGNERTLELVNSDGTSLGTVGADSVKNSLYINEFTIEAAGTYYLTSPKDSNYIFKVEVETTK